MQLIKYAINSDQLAHPNDPVWNKNCPSSMKGDLEHLLFLLKEDRNKISHNDANILALTDSDITNYCITLHQRLPLIIRLAGEKADVCPVEIQNKCNMIVSEIENIRNLNVIVSFDKVTPLQNIVPRYCQYTIQYRRKSAPAISNYYI